MKASKVLFLVLLCILSMCAVNTRLVKSQYFGTIYIANDGGVYSSTNATVPIQRVGDVYTFNDSVTSYSIVVQRSNIIIDGAGHTLLGAGDRGIDLSYRSNVTIRNIQIRGNFFYGIYLLNSFSNKITQNNIANTASGIWIQNSSNNIASANNVTKSLNGISLYSSSSNTLRNNIMNNTYNFAVYGTELSQFVNDVDVSNLINGKKVYYFVGKNDLIINSSTFPDLGFLALVECTGITVQNLDLVNNGQGIMLAFTSGSTITKNYITNNNNGLSLYSSFQNMIFENRIFNNDRGMQLGKSSNSNRISANNITNNTNGIYLYQCSNNILAENNITNSEIGIGFDTSSNNVIYHNSFINNTKQVYDSSMDDSSVTPSTNIWDTSYPSGGNYWSDYTGIDVKRGPNQNQPGSDSIGDKPYIIYANNKDNYPLMPPGSPYVNPPVISIVSPENVTYTVKNVSLIFTVNNPYSWIRYSLDGQANVTISGNITLSGLPNGLHSIKVYTNDTYGNIGTSALVLFSIKTQQSGSSLPVEYAYATAALIVLAVAATAGYLFLKRKK